MKDVSGKGNLPRVVFRIRWLYFDQIRKGEKTSEIRRASPHWLAAVNRLHHNDGGRLGIAVFVCGNQVHRRIITGVRVHTSAREALGREPSPQGRKDLGDGMVFEFRLGARTIR